VSAIITEAGVVHRPDPARLAALARR